VLVEGTQKIGEESSPAAETLWHPEVTNHKPSFDKTAVWRPVATIVVRPPDDEHPQLVGVRAATGSWSSDVAIRGLVGSLHQVHIFDCTPTT